MAELNTLPRRGADDRCKLQAAELIIRHGMVDLLPQAKQMLEDVMKTVHPREHLAAAKIVLDCLLRPTKAGGMAMPRTKASGRVKRSSIACAGPEQSTHDPHPRGGARAPASQQLVSGPHK